MNLLELHKGLSSKLEQDKDKKVYFLNTSTKEVFQIVGIDLELKQEVRKDKELTEAVVIGIMGYKKI